MSVPRLSCCIVVKAGFDNCCYLASHLAAWFFRPGWLIVAVVVAVVVVGAVAGVHGSSSLFVMVRPMLISGVPYCGVWTSPG